MFLDGVIGGYERNRLDVLNEGLTSGILTPREQILVDKLIEGATLKEFTTEFSVGLAQVLAIRRRAFKKLRMHVLKEEEG